MNRLILLLVFAAVLSTACSNGSDNTTNAISEDYSLSQDLLGYRASLYETHAPHDRNNLNGTGSLKNIGLSRDSSVENIEIELIEMHYPVLLYTREPDEIFVFGGTPLAIERYTSLVDGLPIGENELMPYFAKYNPETGEISYVYLDREQTFRYIVGPGSLTLDENWITRFDPDGTGVNEEPTSPMIMNGRVYYTTNTETTATLPIRVFWQDINATYTPDMTALTGPLLFDDPDNEAGFSFSGLAADEPTGFLVRVYVD